MIEKIRVHWFPKLLAGLFVLFVLIGIHGSSVGEWDRVFRSRGSQSFVQLGVSRGIRADDWCVSQPFIYAQCNSDEFFPRYNRSVNGGTDMFLQSPCAPVWDWTALGQMHNWGYFIFGANRGTAWSWWLRYLGLPFFAYFFFLVWCRGDRATSIVGALVVMLGAPAQWWDTTIPYHLLYFFASLVMAWVVASARRVVAVLLGGLGLLTSVLSYFFVMYPPFEILLLPALLVLMVYVIRTGFARDHIWWRIGTFLVVLAGVAAVFFYFFQVHREALEVISRSAYPGTRVCRGGSLPYVSQRFLMDLVSLFTWGRGTTPESMNQCQAAEYCSMFVPVAVAFAWLAVKTRKVCGYETALALIVLVYVAWISMDWPAALAKYTGFSRLPPPRVSVIEGFLVLLLSLRLFTRMADSGLRMGPWGWAGLTAAFALCRVTALFTSNLWGFVNGSGTAMLRFEAALLLSLAVWVAFLGGRRRLFLSLTCATALLTGMFVHPVVNGLAPLYDAEISRVIKKIDGKRPGTWWSNDRAVGQVPLALGLKCLAGTQQYCDRAYWRVMDPSGGHEHVWNRYGHRFVAGFSDRPLFENRGRPDCIYHNVSEEQLGKLGVDYVIWRGRALRSKGMKAVAKVGSDIIYEVRRSGPSRGRSAR